MTPNHIIYEYLSSYVDAVPLGQADVRINVGLNQDILFGTQALVGPDGSLTQPYTAIVERENGNPPTITVTGMGPEGVLSGVKRLVNARAAFLYKGSGTTKSYIDDYDTLGIGVEDLLSGPEAKTYFHQPHRHRQLRRQRPSEHQRTNLRTRTRNHNLVSIGAFYQQEAQHLYSIYYKFVTYVTKM